MIAAAVIVVLAGVFFVGHANGWFDGRNRSVVSVEEESITSTSPAEETTKYETTTEASTKESKEASTKEAESEDAAQAAAPSEKQTAAASGQQSADKPATPEPVKTLTCTVAINCATILNNMDKLDPAKTGLIPTDGWILYTTVAFTEGETAFDVVQRACADTGVAIEYSWSPMYGSSYVEGINNIYEFDCGPESGWMYQVNGVFPNYGSSSYMVSDGDYIAWLYTCTGLGADIGG